MNLLTKEQLTEMLSRAEMAAEVTLPVELFRDLVLQAMAGVFGTKEVVQL